MKAQMIKSPMSKAFLVATMAMLTMVGCANNSSGGPGARLTRDNTATTGVNPNSSGATGAITYNSSRASGGTVNSAVQALLQESVPSGTQIGSVDPNSGMVLAGGVHFDASSPSQNMLPLESYVEIKITDSYALQNPTQYGPFIISVGMNSNGEGWVTSTSNGTDSTDMVFQDSYGWIELQGTFSSTFQGQIYFGTGNYNSATTYTYLGDFSIATCSFFSCQ